jgi:hypothetical protein
MIKKVINTVPLLLLFTLQGCNPGVYTDELSGDYFYEDAGTKMIMNHVAGKQEIFPNVTSYDYNKDFIIARQEADFKSCRVYLAFNLRADSKKYPTNSKEEVIESEKIADSILRNDSNLTKIFVHQTNYWIIRNSTDQVYGPLTPEEYEQKRRELKIPESVELNAAIK